MRVRSYLAGMTDYTGISLEDVHAHLRDWLANTDKTIDVLRGYREKVENESNLLKNPREVISFIDHFVDLFTRYRNDLERLMTETKNEVTASHIEIVNQLYKSSMLEEQSTIRFRDDWVYKTLPHEEMRPLLDGIYGNTRDMLIDYRDLSNLTPRLKTFVRGGSSSSEAFPELHLKPNMFGIGININRILGRLLGRFRKR